MTEKLLQFIWQFQYFNTGEMKTTGDEKVQIIHPGQLNHHQGPDFFNGRVKIGTTEWAGHIELHIKSSDWYRHHHEKDARYGKVILHVVWLHDAEVTDENNQVVPVVELQSRVSGLLLAQYESWMNTPDSIPCGKGLETLPMLHWHNWLDRLLAERLLEKCNRVSQHIEATEMHWEEVCWRMVCTYFGGSVNKTSFQQIATSLPLKILVKHKQVPTQVEALLIGQAGLLHPGLEDPYAKMLYREYQFLQKKYKLQVVNLPPSFLRMRPVNFPTIRLAQLAMLIHDSSHLFSKVLETEDLKEVRKLFDVTANDFWHYHYGLEEETSFLPKKTGSQIVDSVLINAIIPILFSYGHHHFNDAVRAKALRWLEEMPAEKNIYTKLFRELGRTAANAGESQAMLTLKKSYCDAKRCLSCAVGSALLKPVRN
jgi:hypothetical protein